MLFGKNVNIYYLKYIHYFILGIAALIIVDIFQLKIPEYIGEIVDYLDNGTFTMELLLEYTKKMIIIVAVMFLGRFSWRICIFGNGVRIEADMRSKLFQHSELLSQTYYQHNKTGNLMALYTNDLLTIRSAFGSGTMMFVDAIFLGIISFIKMWKKDYVLTIIAGIPLVMLAIASLIAGRFMRKKFQIRQKAYGDLSDFAQESFSGLSVIKAFVKEVHELKAFAKVNQENLDKNMDYIKLSTLVNVLLFGTFIGMVGVAIYGYGSWLVYHPNNNFTVGNLNTFLNYFTTLTWPMMALGQLINLHSQAKASLNRVDQLLNYPIEIKDQENVVLNHTIEGKIFFNHLCFTYPDSEREVLHDITFTIQAGEHIGVIGRTGSGKTTLVDLLLRIYNLKDSKDSPILSIDDIDIMKYPIKELRNQIAYVPQDNFLFSDTIANNIAFCQSKTNMDKVIEAAKYSDVNDNIVEFKEGYETVLGERGVTVSGGQKQRISIARALIKDASILILDDSVSAVDTKTEETILKNLKEIRKNKTTILIAHRISTIKQMDKILLLEDGKVIGFGRHDELLNTCKEYEKMVYLQKLEDEVEE